jgi:cell division protease FtsH
VNILRHHVEGLLPDHELRAVAPLIEGATGAEIMQLVRDARRAARQAVRPLSLGDLRNAALPEAKLEPETLWRICVHEAGHAVGSVALSCGVVKKCVVRDDADGHGATQFETREVELPSRQQVEDRAIVSLCGRAAEEVLIGSVCANAGGDHQSDLATATRLVCSLYSSLGMMGSLVYLGAENMDQLIRLDAPLRKKVDDHLGGLYRKAVDLLHSHRSAVVAVASRLRERRHVSGEEIEKLFHQARIDAGVVGPAL